MYTSAIATFYAPSDNSGLRGMRRERIRATRSWLNTGARHDCALVVDDQGQTGFQGMSVVRVHLFFSFTYQGIAYPCALVKWFKKCARSQDNGTGLWVVESEMVGRGAQRQELFTIIHLDCILRACHLIPVYGDAPLPPDYNHSYSLDSFHSFYVNKYIDHHANEILSN